MPDLFPVTLAEQISEVEREISMRLIVYPRRCAEKRMSAATMERQLATMRAVLATLKNLETPKPPGERAAQQRQE